jgi:small subunit ribosomal protein S15
MTMLVHQRAKILRYLKRKSNARYNDLLPRLGLERRAIEGEIIVPGKPRMAVNV